jgi:hypothetical protein
MSDTAIDTVNNDEINALASLSQEMGLASNVTEESFDLLSSGTFLPRLQLFGASSNACKEGIIAIGHYGLTTTKDQVTDIGTELNCYPLSMRLKAMRLGDQIVNFFDPASKEFKEVMEESKDADSGALCGPEFLLYLPEQNKFVTFFMCSKTMRRQAPKMKALLQPPRAARLRVNLIRTKKYSWHGPVIDPCSVPLPTPDIERARDEIEVFNNPKSSEIELVGAPGDAPDRDR